MASNPFTAVVGDVVPPVLVGTIVTPAGSAFEVYGESAAVTPELIDALTKYTDGTGAAKSLFFSPHFRLVPAGTKVTPRPLTMDQMGDYFEARKRATGRHAADAPAPDAPHVVGG